MSQKAAPSSLDPEEVSRFSAKAAGFWDPAGPFAALHRIQDLRLAFVRQSAERLASSAKRAPLAGLKVLDVGCGGGLLAEPMARDGAMVCGLDASSQAIEVAKAHAALEGLAIEYRATTAEAYAQQNPRARFDMIVAVEILEHVASVPSFLATVAGLLKPGGVLVLSTMNKTIKSYLLGVLAAEYVLGWVPPGTHDWQRFLSPAALDALLEPLGLEPVRVTGMVFDPAQGRFVMAPHKLDVNYFMAAQKRRA